jgi:hypothetical protein
MNEIKQKLADLELALNYVCYDAALIPKLSKVWDKLELLKAEVNKNCNAPDVSKRKSQPPNPPKDRDVHFGGFSRHKRD